LYVAFYQEKKERSFFDPLNKPSAYSVGWWLVLVCSERRVLLAGCWWLVCSERKVLLAGG
jgi:hypothetical protein